MQDENTKKISLPKNFLEKVLIFHFFMLWWEYKNTSKGGYKMDSKLEQLTQIAHGVASHFGNACEVVIHDLKKQDIESSIVYIENGETDLRKSFLKRWTGILNA